MGLLSFLFGGSKKDKPAKAAARPAEAPKPAEKAKLKAADKLVAKAATTVAVAPRVGVLKLKMDYAASRRAGEHARAYDAACALAKLYRKTRAKGLELEYRAAAEAEFAGLLAASGRRAAMARRVPAGSRAAKLAGPQAAKLIAAHEAFTAEF
jgi:hypothetical protein